MIPVSADDEETQLETGQAGGHVLQDWQAPRVVRLE